MNPGIVHWGFWIDDFGFGDNDQSHIKCSIPNGPVHGKIEPVTLSSKATHTQAAVGKELWFKTAVVLSAVPWLGKPTVTGIASN